MRISLLTNDDSPDVGQSAETKTVHKPILLYKIYLLASGKADWMTRSLQSPIYSTPCQQPPSAWPDNWARDGHLQGVINNF